MTAPSEVDPGTPFDVEPAGPAGPGGERGARRTVLRYALAKAGGAVLSIGMVIVATFFLFRLIPGDPAIAYTRDVPLDPAQLDRLRHQMGLDKPLMQQFLDFVGRTLTLDLGTSYEYKRPVADLIAERVGPTLVLVGTGLVIAVSLGLWQGTRAAWKHGSRFDRFSTGLSLVLWSVPTFWLGLLLLMVFAAGVGPIPGIFPTRGMEDVDAPDGPLYLLHVAHHLVLPCLTLVAVVYAQYLLVMRSSLLDEIGQDYVTTARAKGLRDDQVRRRHAVPNALLPTVTLVFIHIGFVVGGAVSVETVYSWPGLGLLFYEAIQGPDFAVMQGTFMVVCTAVIVMNTLADVAYHVLDPRVRSA
ncbi:peptide/nickel transport system permease protein [Streptosporangium subroseum]|uniref:Peptide/nickel transport system permease protein n=1 Tax=Streptosporangium subroseum TaxID=106412 RepID=A0A239FSZ4_9ACTN|nr:ABC transporter permease [Streptosporangium subroseum]SNS59971.1 peptide/nickel transport system permease protein [Streptosporangium subroseum]